MTNNFNVSLGKSKDSQQLSSGDLKGGVKKDDIKDQQMKTIFEMLDSDNNGILEESEIKKIKTSIFSCAQEDNDVSNLSKKEAKHLISALGLKGVKVKDLFKFLGFVKSAASNIDYQTRDTADTNIIDIKYKADKTGSVVTKQYNSKNGNLVGSFIIDNDGNEFYKDAEGKITRGKDNIGNYTRKYNETNGYTDTYEDKSVRTYDKDGKLLSGTTSDGKTINYSSDGKELGGSFSNDKSWSTQYNNDGSYVRNYDNNETIKYDSEGRMMSGTLSDGTITWNRKYNDNGYTDTYSDNSSRTYDSDGKLLRGQMADGKTFECVYDNQGNKLYEEYTQKDGVKYYYGGTDETEMSSAYKTAMGNLKVHPKQGESFDDTMTRLGITDPKDQALFKKSNPKAYKRGYFLLSAPGSRYGDVYIPKSIADKLDMNNVLVDSNAEFEKYQKRRNHTFDE